ncbi:MAG: metallophosphoesterase [Terriglobia bacterium]
MRRRNFLKHGIFLPMALSGSAVKLLPEMAGPLGGRNRWSFIHFTDIHVQPELRAAQGFEQAVQSMNQLDPNPAFAIAGGDLVMDAYAQNYSRADHLYELYQGIVKRVNFPVHSVLGNHDVFGVDPVAQVSSSHPEYGKKMFANRVGKGKTYRSFDYQDWHFILLDSIQIDPHLNYQGGIDEAQLEWLKTDLQAVGKMRPVVLVTHIPFFTILPTLQTGSTEPVPASTVIKNSKEVLDFTADFNIRLILQGHVHIVESHGYKKEQIVTSGAVCGNWWKGPRLGHPEGYAIYTIEGDEISWNYHPFGWKAVEA